MRVVRLHLPCMFIEITLPCIRFDASSTESAQVDFKPIASEGMRSQPRKLKLKSAPNTQRHWSWDTPCQVKRDPSSKEVFADPCAGQQVPKALRSSIGPSNLLGHIKSVGDPFLRIDQSGAREPCCATCLLSCYKGIQWQ